MSKRNRRAQKARIKKKPRRYQWLLPLLVAIIVGGGVVIWLRATGNLPLAQNNFALGPVNACQNLPLFTADVGLSRQVLIDTTQQGFTGVVLRDLSGGVYQDPSWDDAGSLGPHASDSQGNIYLTPVALENLLTNPPAEQNKVYRIDTHTGVMKEFISLPWQQPPSGSNPFGAVGLAYDCDSNSLYVASVAGSTPQDEVGRIYQIDLSTGEIAGQFEDVDALGIGIFNGAQGKRLYFGSARTPKVYSIPLNVKGEFSGEARFEFSLAALKGGSYDNAHRIKFTRDNQMQVKGVEFGFKLFAASDPMRNIYLFDYDSDNDSWNFISVEAQQ